MGISSQQTTRKTTLTSLVGSRSPATVFDLPDENEDDRKDKLRLPVVTNLFGDFTNGVRKAAEAHATALSAVGLNYGFPLGIDEDLALGWQLGGDIALHEEQRFEADFTTGAFIRDLKVDEETYGGGALLADYHHTEEHADLTGLRFVAGMSTRSGHHLGVRGAYPLNEEIVRRAGVVEEAQELTMRHEAFWGYDFDGRLGTEVSLGYQSDDVNELLLRLSASYSLNPFLALAPMGEINTAGDHSAGVSVVYDFSGSRRRSMLTHFGRRAEDDFTPFRKRSFP